MKILRMIGLSIGLAGLLIAAFLVIQAPESVQALPPRPEPKAEKNQIKGGFIELTVSGSTSDVWTAVQWQDNDGNWILVDGWQGSTNAENQVLWYVAKENLGEDPFRWMVYDAPDGSLLAASDPFELPERAKQTVFVEVVLP